MNFYKSEAGAVTVDWVVLTASIVGLGIATMTVVSTGVQDSADDTRAQLDGTIISTSFTPGGGGAAATGPEGLIQAYIAARPEGQYVNTADEANLMHNLFDLDRHSDFALQSVYSNWQANNYDTRWAQQIEDLNALDPETANNAQVLAAMGKNHSFFIDAAADAGSSEAMIAWGIAEAEMYQASYEAIEAEMAARNLN